MKGRTWAFGIYFSADWRSLPAGVNYMVYAHRPMRETTGTFGLIHFVESVRYNKVKAALGVVFEDDLEAETVRACHIEDKENFILGFEDGRTLGSYSVFGPRARRRPTEFFKSAPRRLVSKAIEPESSDVEAVLAIAKSKAPDFSAGPEDFRQLRKALMEQRPQDVDPAVCSKYKRVLDYINGVK